MFWYFEVLGLGNYGVHFQKSAQLVSSFSSAGLQLNKLKHLVPWQSKDEPQLF